MCNDFPYGFFLAGEVRGNTAEPDVVVGLRLWVSDSELRGSGLRTVKETVEVGPSKPCRDRALFQRNAVVYSVSSTALNFVPQTARNTTKMRGVESSVEVAPRDRRALEGDADIMLDGSATVNSEPGTLAKGDSEFSTSCTPDCPKSDETPYRRSGNSLVEVH
jgi:hypothetical protein